MLALKSCLSTPLVSNDKLIGVLSLYSVTPGGFSDDNRRVLDLAATHVAQALERAIEFDSSTGSDSVSSLPHLDQLTSLIDSTNQNGLGLRGHHGLLIIDVIGLNQISREYGPSTAEDILETVARQTRAGLRSADVLFRSGGDKFVALLEIADATTTDLVASRVRDAIGRVPLDVSSGQRISVRTEVTAVASPQDGTSLLDLLTVARDRSKSPTTHRDVSAVH